MCKMERWLDVGGFEGLYQVSDLGRIRSVDRGVSDGKGRTKKMVGRVLRLSPDSRGYLVASVCKEGKRRIVRAHRLVLAAFVGPCPDGCEVRHGANGVEDNSVGNLSYGTHIKNQLDRRRDGTDNGRKVVRNDGFEFNSINQAAEKSDCHASVICRVCRGKGKTAGGYGWKYAEDDE